MPARGRAVTVFAAGSMEARSDDGAAGAANYYRFTLSEAKQICPGLRRQDADANLILEDADGNVLHSGANGARRTSGCARRCGWGGTTCPDVASRSNVRRRFIDGIDVLETEQDPMIAGSDICARGGRGLRTRRSRRADGVVQRRQGAQRRGGANASTPAPESPDP